MQPGTTTKTRWSAWDYRDAGWSGTDLSGFEIEAFDGSIGKVDDATWETGGSYLIIDTGPWIFGKKVMLPAGVVSRIDRAERRVYVDRTKDQIRGAPEYDESRMSDTTFRNDLATYYGEGGRGWREPGF